MTKSHTLDPRLKAFRAKRVKHSKLSEIMESLVRIAENPRPECIVVLIGPSGVGKSTVLRALKKRLREHYAERMRTDPGFLPYVSIEAVTGMDGHYNWKDAFIRTLLSSGEILIENKVIPRFEMELDGKNVSDVRPLVKDELRRALESLVIHRKVPIFLVDEASAILRVKAGMKTLLQFEILKSLAVRLKIPIVLVGAYDLLGILDGNGQLVRRSDVIHFSRYNMLNATDNTSDEEEFAHVLRTFLESMDVPKEKDFIEHVDYFMLKSIGCIGNLKDWLDRSLVETLASPEGMLTMEILQRTSLSNRSLALLTNEALVGELRLADIPDGDLAKLLGFEYTPSLTLAAPVAMKTKGPKAKAKTHIGRVGLRGASRDQSGGVRG